MKEQNKKELIVIVGPTAIGKTKLAIELAQHYHTEIISADSRQFYRELQIGTAAPEKEELDSVPHHLIGNISIHEYYNVFKFETEALKIAEELFQKYQRVIMVGGSGMYIDAFCYGIDDIPDVKPEIREKLSRDLQTHGVEPLLKMLEQLDPDILNVIDTKNPKRVLRAVEVSLSSGKPYSSFRTSKVKKRPFKMTRIGLNTDRPVLYSRIDKRVLSMVAKGLVEEAKQFEKFRNLNSLNTVGYKELFPYFDGNYSLERAIELIQRNSRRFAKRQISWFMRDQTTQWFCPEQKDEMIRFIENNS